MLSGSRERRIANTSVRERETPQVHNQNWANAKHESRGGATSETPRSLLSVVKKRRSVSRKILLFSKYMKIYENVYFAMASTRKKHVRAKKKGTVCWESDGEDNHGERERKREHAVQREKQSEKTSK